VVENEKGSWKNVSTCVFWAVEAILVLLGCLSEGSLQGLVLGCAAVFLLLFGVLGSMAKPSREDPTKEEVFRNIVRSLKSLVRNLESFLGGLTPPEDEVSSRQREIWYEDVLSQSVPQVKESLREKSLDLEAVLEAEKRRRNREELVQWLKELIEGDSNGR